MPIFPIDQDVVMESPRSTAGLLLVGVLVFGCEGGCERGCERRNAPSVGGATLAGTDCSDGLVRCVEGQVETSRLAHLPHPCGSMKEGKRSECVCPWDIVARCEKGCVAEGLVAIGDPDAGSRQLCRVDETALGTVLRPPLPGDPGLVTPRICNDVGVDCIDGSVRRCDGAGAPEQILSVCLHGCEPGIAIDHGERMIGDGAAEILCRRAHAERR
jgi:hypothetical protein